MERDVDARPALVARCAGPADVTASVAFARERYLSLAVKAGSHNVAGRAVCDDGLVVDLSPMDTVRVDPDERTAVVGPRTCGRTGSRRGLLVFRAAEGFASWDPV